MDLKGRRMMVVGLGVTGHAVARFLDGRGAHLVMVDRTIDLPTGGLPPGEVRLGPDNPAWLAGIDLVVTSPGVARSSTLLAEAHRRRIPVIGELELAGRFVAAPLIAVTGTNGKSTVTSMLGKIFDRSGRRVFVGGNLGTPLIEAAERRFEICVVEASSFQLETIETFRPRVAVYLNLSEDHCDRYRGLDDYGAAKARIFENQQVYDWAVLNRDDPCVWRNSSSLRSHVVSFSHQSTSDRCAIRPDEDSLIFRDGERTVRIPLEGFSLAGRHNLANAMAAAAAALVMGVGPGAIASALAQFTGLAHRMEIVGRRAGVSYVDDSKATNVAAAIEALRTVAGPVVLLAGGMDKGGDYGPLRAELERRGRRIILFGAARNKIERALAGVCPTDRVETLEEAVACAASAAHSGDTVLLSPACSSFDRFTNYAERGEIFKKLVLAL